MQVSNASQLKINTDKVEKRAQEAQCCANANCQSQQVTTYSKCAACMVAKYCGSTCQTADWKRHRMECKMWQNAKKNDLGQ